MTAIFAPVRMIEDQLAALVARNGICCRQSGRTDPVGGDAKERGAVAKVFMILVNPETIHLWKTEAAARAKEAPAEVWERCSAHVS